MKKMFYEELQCKVFVKIIGVDLYEETNEVHIHYGTIETEDYVDTEIKFYKTLNTARKKAEKISKENNVELLCGEED